MNWQIIVLICLVVLFLPLFVMGFLALGGIWYEIFFGWRRTAHGRSSDRRDTDELVVVREDPADSPIETMIDWSAELDRYLRENAHKARWLEDEMTA
jgi:hypothetical protein